MEACHAQIFGAFLFPEVTFPAAAGFGPGAISVPAGGTSLPKAWWDVDPEASANSTTTSGDRGDGMLQIHSLQMFLA